MSALILARWQFAIVTVYHFFFVPLTLGLSIFVAILETMYVRTGDEKYKKMTKFWGKLFLINFAIGVATGLVQEFQFGMNWSEYSRFMGDIFGAPLAIEALLAFFLESTFIGLWIFGWDKLSKKAHAVTIWMVAIGSNLSAFWILVANSFMQEPVGYILRNGRAEMVDFLALVTNPHVWIQFPHVVSGGISAAAFFVIPISIYQLFIKKTASKDVFQTSLKFAAFYGLVGILIVTLGGHTQMQHMVKAQPMKVAAAEALWETEQSAGLSLLTISNESERKEVFSIKIPGLLSLLSHDKFDAEVKGINDIQKEYELKYGEGNYIPPVNFTYLVFRGMAGAGTAMLAIILLLLFYVMKDRYDFKPWMVTTLLWSLFLPLIANSTGWLLAEVGRQPWAVFGLMKVDAAVSNTVTPIEVLITVVGYTLLYAVLMVADIYLMKKYAVMDIDEIEKTGKEA
jgi:cytochrome d ubiquinol oxidase subunit I